ncbi:MAG: universal stress protein [bacterium]
MIAIQRILVPTDFSENARNALELAVLLAEKFGAKIILLYVFEMPAAAGQTLYHLLSKELEESRRDLYRLIRAKSWGALKDLVRRYSESIVEIDPLFFEEGIPFVEIIRVAKELDVQLIVMSTHGRTGLSNLLIGSVAEKVVRKAPCPVLTVRSKTFQFEMP